MQSSAGASPRYEPTWESLDSRPCPPWYDQAKFGIFIHWGVYSVPAWAPKGAYSEWYWWAMQDPNGETWRFHVNTYGEDFRYQDFAPMFKAELFDPAEWADLFARSGARYIALTSKHHDGFCLWPSPHAWNWNSADIGPHRDLVGELAQAVRARGLKMGLYYSLYEWFHPVFRSDLPRYVQEHMLPQLKDVIERSQPSLLFTDGEWDHPSESWRSAEFLAWLFNESAVRDEIVVNDRWGKETRSEHGGYYTSEYGEVGGGKRLAAHHKWEENRGIGASFGYNRNEAAEDYLSERDAIHLLVNTVSRGGNLLLDIGPTADGRIPVIQQERLLQIGEWLGVNGEAIYGTRPWHVSGEGDHVRYTASDDALYAICLQWPPRELVLQQPRPAGAVRAALLGSRHPVECRAGENGLHVTLPPISPDDAPCRSAYVLKLTCPGRFAAAEAAAGPR